MYHRIRRLMAARALPEPPSGLYVVPVEEAPLQALFRPARDLIHEGAGEEAAHHVAQATAWPHPDRTPRHLAEVRGDIDSFFEVAQLVYQAQPLTPTRCEY